MKFRLTVFFFIVASLCGSPLVLGQNSMDQELIEEIRLKNKRKTMQLKKNQAITINTVDGRDYNGYFKGYLRSEFYLTRFDDSTNLRIDTSMISSICLLQFSDLESVQDVLIKSYGTVMYVLAGASSVVYIRQIRNQSAVNGGPFIGVIGYTFINGMIFTNLLGRKSSGSRKILFNENMRIETISSS